MKCCHKCGEIYDQPDKPGFNDTCEKCFAFIHSCANCRLYNPKLSGRCESNTTEAVRDPQGKNFCEEFEFADSDKGKSAADKTKEQSDKTRDKFDSLFGN